MFLNTPSAYASLDDRELLNKYQQTQDLQVLGALYHRYMHLVYGVCLKYLKNPEDSKDAVMQIFEKLIGQVNRQEIDNFKSWLYVVSKNHCLMELRQQKKWIISKENDQVVMEIIDDLHPNGEEKELDLERLSQALLNLPEHQKQCVELFYYQNKSYQEIAEETGYEIKKVKSYIQNGKRKLKGLMNRE